MSSAVPTIWRALTGPGSRLTSANTAQASSGATMHEPSAPSFASARSCPWKARLEISRETVNPMPATAPPPASDGQLSAGRVPCRAGREASQEAAEDPEWLAHDVAEQDARA